MRIIQVQQWDGKTIAMDMEGATQAPIEIYEGVRVIRVRTKHGSEFLIKHKDQSGLSTIPSSYKEES